MRSTKPFVVAFELAAACGTALVLGGTALAADGPAQVPVTGSPGNIQQTVQQAADSASRSVKVPSAPNPPDGGLGPTPEQTKPVAPEQPSATKNSGAAPVRPPRERTQSDQVGIPKVTVVQVQTPLPEQPAADTKMKASSAAGPAVGSVSGAAEKPTVLYKITVMPLQPTITGREAAIVNDLASNVPTPPKRDKAPAPTKSSGALGAITAVLAGVVVPQLFALPALAASRITPVLEFGVLLPVMLGVFVFSYGLWLRRGGFATAARSDSPAAADIPYLLHHSFWAMSQRYGAKYIAQFLVSETNGLGYL